MEESIIEDLGSRLGYDRVVLKQNSMLHYYCSVWGVCLLDSEFVYIDLPDISKPCSKASHGLSLVRITKDNRLRSPLLWSNLESQGCWSW